MRARTGRLGLFRIFGHGKAGKMVAVPGIGFVSHFLGVGCWLLAVGLVELGSFRIFWFVVRGW